MDCKIIAYFLLKETMNAEALYCAIWLDSVPHGPVMKGPPDFNLNSLIFK